jgi:hypothetical protein
VTNNENSTATQSVYFLLRSIIIGFALYLPACFFSQTRKVLRFIRDLEVVQAAANIFQLIIILTLLGLILQGLFQVLCLAMRSFAERKSEKP